MKTESAGFFAGEMGLFEILLAVITLLIGIWITLFVAHFIYQCRRRDERMKVVREAFAEFVLAAYAYRNSYLRNVRLFSIYKDSDIWHECVALGQDANAIARVCRLGMSTAKWDRSISDVVDSHRHHYEFMLSVANNEIPINSGVQEKEDGLWISLINDVDACANVLRELDDWDPLASKFSLPST